MDKKKVVLALGHKALGKTLPEQQVSVAFSAAIIADLIEEGCQIVITHSNAPQVGMIHTAMNEFGKEHEDYTMVPMSVCSAMSQGYIGYDLQNAIRSELIKRGIFKTVSTVITQVTVDPYDEAFYHPVKIIGRELTKAEADIEEQKGNTVVEVAPDIYKRIVAAPRPKDIIEIDAIKALVNAGQIVIACGGGGIPVLEQKGRLKGAGAVIEKDLVSQVLADQIDADCLMILTGVEKVSINFEKENESYLDNITVAQAETYRKEGHFAAGSMLPKIEASIDFVRGHNNRKALITSIEKARQGYLGKTGTVITS